ncbi:putative ribonuclease P/MRP protein subunit POP5 [Acorus gramineus]|uniref:Ribonuclease P/MRP protein subunit POP5 n=1 Tax=Acorus gramineus TaxID=55184 RepID=A0AAV9ABR0_ACOGR|nr:putative ribonuclease P/MRP protein subunit POP5 [Acorus gramineus]
MVAFKNRYMVIEVFLDANKDLGKDDPIIISQFNLTKAIKDSILVNFGECGLALSLGSFQRMCATASCVVKYVNPITKLCVIRASREEHQKVWWAITMVKSIGNCPTLFNLLDLSGSIKACKDAALKCDMAKFEQYKLLVGDRLSPEITRQVQNCFEKIKILEH